tara:strand:- start:1439 stop:1540 length:102 start_codon:yes stop_codon:yes gene_type:complete
MVNLEIIIMVVAVELVVLEIFLVFQFVVTHLTQ